jgi:hypothetical protein
MSGGEAVLLLFGIVGGALLSIVTWWAFRPQVFEAGSVPSEKQFDLLLVLLVIGAFALGAFITYALLHAF